MDIRVSVSRFSRYKFRCWCRLKKEEDNEKKKKHLPQVPSIETAGVVLSPDQRPRRPAKLFPVQWPPRTTVKDLLRISPPRSCALPCCWWHINKEETLDKLIEPKIFFLLCLIFFNMCKPDIRMNVEFVIIIIIEMREMWRLEKLVNNLRFAEITPEVASSSIKWQKFITGLYYYVSSYTIFPMNGLHELMYVTAQVE